jgi:hypothetical protein
MRKLLADGLFFAINVKTKKPPGNPRRLQIVQIEYQTQLFNSGALCWNQRDDDDR